MELIHVIMDIVIPPIILLLLLIAIPFNVINNLVSFIQRSFSLEDLSGKVVLITGASSGIGEFLAYAYAKKGARLVLVARREQRLREVADKARKYGSPDVLVCAADVSKVEDCKRFVQDAIDHFGCLDHLVNNAGITSGYTFESTTDITTPINLMNVNFWGSVYPTYFAVPHLKKSKGRIVVIASLASWLYSPQMIFYGASKAAMMNFFETLRVELGSSVKITIVSPGFIESEMTQGKHLTNDGSMQVDPEKRDSLIGMFPVRGVFECAKTIVHGVRRGDRNITDPSWFRVLYICKVFISEILEWFFRVLMVPQAGVENSTLTKKILDFTGMKKYIYPASIDDSSTPSAADNVKTK
ncbi:hypothetical protein MKW94_001533 [Papaver nudicaule]|uniref:Uncharacterized protein n=1 Tax=Papaver nudicaule TaxID=74823 RepID=A0AA41RU35_PAPNU|nr:hypothetical protein [Papaver nudicaule]